MRKDHDKSGAKTKEDGDKLWQIVTKDVRPLHKAAQPIKPGATLRESGAAKKPKPTRMKTETVTLAAMPAPVSVKARATSDRTLENRLRKDLASIEGKIDLHGNTAHEAHKRLMVFIKKSYGAGKRYLLVITGKGRNGGGVIRGEFRLWLDTDVLRPYIFSVSEAEPRHGGAGAFYVILKKNKS